MFAKPLSRALTAPVVAGVMVVMFAMTASAYTLVLRDGRRIEIPAEFTVNQMTLTYEISPGFSRTLQVSVINIAATERINREVPGSFFNHKVQEVPVDNQPVQKAARTITNSDLTAFRERRVESEQAYEARRKELGLPTVEESRRRQEEDGVALTEQVRA